MEIKSSEINSDSINLATHSPVAGLSLSYGKSFENVYTLSGLNTTDINITKEALGLVTLDNIYFKLELLDALDKKAAVGLYNIEVLNQREAQIYDANKLKQELDNLNYYDGIIDSLNRKERFLEANDFFFNYITFLEKKLNGNNFIKTVKR
jgi:hypothetical protein